jgi:uncharacterized protein (UPF0332 family)
VNADAARLLDKARRAVHAAEVLLAAGEPDFAAGRAYYAMFYAAEALLAVDGLRYRKHSAVHSAFGERYVSGGVMDARYHRWLLDAFDKRIAGDYDIEYALSPADVVKMVEQSKEFIAAVGRVVAER